ncbi:MAG: hypothetical protein IJ033_03435 [Clostridia bacterium]|nr:hypothetical protein [Clostridia bacterium]
MKLTEIITNLDAKVINVTDANKEIEGGYCGDFLSVVMGKAPENSGWFTIMNNQNVAAVASLTEVGVIIICDGVEPDELLAKKVAQVGLDLIVTPYPVFEAVKKSGL